MNNLKTPRYQPSYTANDTERTIRFPWPSDLNDQRSYGNHLQNIQWMAQGFGGTLNSEQTEWLFKFDPEEYNCVLRYLSNPKFNLTRNA
jgi:hypothetical protein